MLADRGHRAPSSVPNGCSLGAAAACAAVAARVRACSWRRPSRPRAVEVRQLLLAAGLARLNGGSWPGRPAGCPAAPSAGRRTRRVAVVALAERDRVGAAAGLEAHVPAVAVEVLALAGEADHRVPELLVVLGAGRKRVVVDHDVARRAGSRRARTSSEVDLRQQRRSTSSPSLREVAVAGCSSASRPRSSAWRQ